MISKAIRTTASLAAICLFVLATGCSTANPLKPQTRFQDAGTLQQAPRLDYSAEDENVRLVLESIVLPNGPGAWLEDAPWDEYQIRVENLGSETVRIDQVQLIDPRGVYLRAGMDPEVLESESERLAENYKDAGISVAIAMAPSALAGAAVATGTMTLGGAVALGALGPAAVVAGPAAYFYRKHVRAKDKEKIAAEFSRRASVATRVAPGGVIEGSAFFPIIPEPRALVLEYWIGTEGNTLELPLEAELAGLHVQPSQ